MIEFREWMKVGVLEANININYIDLHYILLCEWILHPFSFFHLHYRSLIIC